MDPSEAAETEPGNPAKLGGRRNPVAEGGGAIDARRLAPPPKTLTVAQVVTQIRGLIERQFPGPLWIEGELSNCSYPASGHIYFSLVDEQATDRFGQRLVLPCAFYRGANQHLKLKLADGMKVLCLGQLTTYERQGQYQLRVLRVEPRGIGALQLAFEQLKKRLQAEGLFDEARKQPIPVMPERVGIITSPTGSAIHDMVSKLRPWFRVVILPVKVQGEGASREIAAAIDLANRLRLAEVLIIGRGGGSVEDLWAFNEEPVARAIARSRTPVISAVGHQDDWTIADYVADLRASTPTDAAKLLVREKETRAQQSQQLVERLLEAMQGWLDEQSQALDALQSQLRLLHPRAQMDRYLARTQELSNQLTATMRFTLNGHSRRLQGLAGTLQALSPLAVLSRGYSVTFTFPEHRVVTSAEQVQVGDEMETILSKGRIRSAVTQFDIRHSTIDNGADDVSDP
ncbi:MAG: exodeoxyribonuclease VII large subunit [Candidatus Omnitrophica bacterium]|nr:exodeoxyribonuclease VII large subunit [Candidatus Omnitrophota bacterium]